MIACMQGSGTQLRRRKGDQGVLLDLAALLIHLLKSGGANFFQAVEDLDLSFSQVKALHVLAEVEEETSSIKELAVELGLSLAAVSRAVDGLVRRGLVTRYEAPEDRRAKHVVTTEAGREVVDHLMELRLAHLADFLAGLPDPDRARLADALGPIVASQEIAAIRETVARRAFRRSAAVPERTLA